MQGRVGVVGVPFATPYPPDTTKPNRRVSDGPDALRRLFRLPGASRAAEAWVDYGNVRLDLPATPVAPDQVVSLERAITAGVNECVLATDFVVILGGECYLAAGTLPPLLTRYKDLHVLWFDAHPDFLNEAQSTSHFLDGMSMARVVGLAGSQSGLLRRDQITLLGGQEVEEAESQAMTKWGLDCVRLQEIDAWVKGSLPGGDLFLHVDADVLDPADMPAVDFPVTPGMRAGQLLDVCTRIAATGRLRGIEVTCYNPALDEMDRGGRRLRSLIETVLPA